MEKVADADEIERRSAKNIEAESPFFAAPDTTEALLLIVAYWPESWGRIFVTFARD